MAVVAALCLAAFVVQAQAQMIRPTQARCVFESTTLNKGRVATGSAVFIQPVGQTTVAIQMAVCGLSVGAHTFHVHIAGNLFLGDGNSVLGHFNGSCTSCRPVTALQEVSIVCFVHPVLHFVSSRGVTACSNEGAVCLCQYGNLNDGNAVTVGADGCLRYNFSESIISLTGPTGFLGMFHR